MSGLDKIIGQISAEAEEGSARVLAEASAKAESLLSEARAKAAEESGRIAGKSGTDAEDILERSVYSAELKKKQIMLAGKQELIADTVAKAREKLASLGDEEYISFIERLFAKHVPSQNAVIMFNEKDLGRIPSEVKDSFISKARENGAELTVSGEAAAIKNGFILDYGDIEENCTFDALFDQSVEDIQDLVKKLLFA